MDCIVIGYNDPPFEAYERFLRVYGEHSEAYRDLMLSTVRLDGKKLNYVDLMNQAHGRAGDAGEFRSGDIPNLAALYLTLFLQRRGFQADYVNLFQSEKERLKQQLASNPLCVAVTTTFYVLNFPAREIADFVRKHNPSVKIVVGGPLIANHFRDETTKPGDGLIRLGEPSREDRLAATLADTGADIFVVEGQGESTLAEIVAALKSGGGLDTIPNVAYFEDGRLRVNPRVEEENSLDANYIDWTAFRDSSLGQTIQTRTARSCAFKCSFCNYPTRAGALSLMGLGAIEKELDAMHALGNVQNVVFIDDTFNVPLERFKEICRLMIRKRYGFKWFSYFRCSNSDSEAIDLLAESGCGGVFLGIESGAPAILRNMHKAATIEKYEQGIQMLKAAGVLTFASLIVGFPGETDDTVEQTIAFIRNTSPDYYRAQVWYCELGTPIDRQRDQFKISGSGFVWSHATMDSLDAIAHVERMLLRVRESLWLPQWSFDFWIIPYLLGKGISRAQLSEFVRHAGQLLALNIASVPEADRLKLESETMAKLRNSAASWVINGRGEGG